ncbi:hypothetical protein [Planosporangium mesophilum]|uniref:Uncharacterized protein n=1 Tax=Planosporangium mesophilum TaxID=689768 RepID=A0A8J3TC22_9ACTN|nr:hypothetical protein [Planosporangium mesophilum]NJC83166.1 hypothetical protein [Planosporangium mesophilum]GII22586.1 hypothetical protein Pme01_21830 [Planosporangium mesophilum]
MHTRHLAAVVGGLAAATAMLLAAGQAAAVPTAADHRAGGSAVRGTVADGTPVTVTLTLTADDKAVADYATAVATPGTRCIAST